METFPPQGSHRSASGELRSFGRAAVLCFYSGAKRMTVVQSAHTPWRKNFREHCPGCLPELFYFCDLCFKFLCRSRTGSGWWQMWPVPPSYCCWLWGMSFCSPLVPGDVVQGAHTPQLCLGASNAFIYVMHWLLQFAMNHWCLLGTHTRFWLFLLQCYNGHKDT